MAKKSEAREIIRLVCTEDGKSYYTTTKNKNNTKDRLELMKYNSNIRKCQILRDATPTLEPPKDAPTTKRRCLRFR
jgi:large subunit ribosomal protein L33